MQQEKVFPNVELKVMMDDLAAYTDSVSSNVFSLIYFNKIHGNLLNECNPRTNYIRERTFWNCSLSSWMVRINHVLPLWTEMVVTNSTFLVVPDWYFNYHYRDTTTILLVLQWSLLELVQTCKTQDKVYLVFKMKYIKYSFVKGNHSVTWKVITRSTIVYLNTTVDSNIP